jgi:hypothetical protein
VPGGESGLLQNLMARILRMNFPWITLRNIQSAAHEAGTLHTQETERQQALADELVLLCTMLNAKVNSWADEIRRRTLE